MPEPLWYRNAIVYSLSVETFMDGNGDGVGDFQGLRRRLDYLESLGIDVIWLAPSQPSPNRDDGYDVADYYGIERRYGSSGDFAEFMSDASGRGIRVLMDFVPNHTSDRHPWFLDARRDARSPYRDWYVWSKKRPSDLRSGVVYPGVQKSTWTYARDAGAWYFHRFLDFQPDLNTTNPAVREELHRVMAYWLRLGVSGFRVDAVPFLLEKPLDGRQSTQPHFEYLRELRDVLQWNRGDAVLLGEANIVPRDDAEYFGDGHGLQMLFNFWVNQNAFYALASGDVRPLRAALRETAKVPQGSAWAYFLRNHDELDLGRLTSGQRQEVFSSFAPEPSMQLYGRGIRRRLAPMLGDPSRIRLAYSLLLALPGAPVLRYGEEIGMGENLRLKERDAVRTPMQWSDEKAAGFSTADELVRPVIASGPYGFESVNVDAQLRDESSLLRWLMKMIGVRKQAREIGGGRWRLLPVRGASVLALRYDLDGSGIVTLHNFDDRPHDVSIDVDGDLSSLLDEETHSGAKPIALDAFGYRWYRIRSRRP